MVTGTGLHLDSFTLRGGIGIGGGVPFNPKGKRQDPCAAHGSNSVGVLAEGAASALIVDFRLGYNAGLSTWTDSNGPFTTQPMAAVSRRLVVDTVAAESRSAWGLKLKEVLESSGPRISNLRVFRSDYLADQKMALANGTFNADCGWLDPRAMACDSLDAHNIREASGLSRSN